MMESVLVIGLAAIECLLLVMIYEAMSRRISSGLSILFCAYSAIFFIAKPLLAYFLELSASFAPNDFEAIWRYLVINIIFYCVLLVTTVVFFGKLPNRFGSFIFDYSEISISRLYVCLLGTFLISYIVNVIKFGSATYFLQRNDSFEATMALAEGSWYMNILAAVSTFSLTALVSRLYVRFPPVLSLIYIVVLLFLTYFISQPSSRTAFLTLILAWFFCYPRNVIKHRPSYISLALFGYCCLIFLYLGNFVRLGLTPELNAFTIFVSPVLGLLTDSLPADNALLLIRTFDTQPTTDFLYLLGAITPLVLVPSSILPIKLPANKDAILTNFCFPGGIDSAYGHAGSTETFTVTGSGYADAYFLGAAISSALYALVLIWYAQLARSENKSVKFVAAGALLIHIAAIRLSIESTLIQFYEFLLFFALLKLSAVIRWRPSR